MSSDDSLGRGARHRDLESLGPRGEGWVGIQSALGLLILVVAPLTARAWPEGLSGLVGSIGVAIVFAGIGLFVLGGITLGRSFSIWIKPRPGVPLLKHGIYRWMRHPVCTAQVLIGLGWALAWGSLVALALVPLYAWYLDRYKLEIEERWLAVTYPEYPAYRSVVRHRMIPWPPGGQPRAAPGGGAADTQVHKG